MRILVFGAGSLGCAVGGILARRHEVTLVGRKENMDAISQRGLSLTGKVETVAKVDTSESVAGLLPPDLLILATKSYQTKDVVQFLEGLPWSDTLVLTLQNGLGNLEIIRGWKGEKAFGGTTTMGAVVTSPGQVRISGLGRTVIGSDLDPSAASAIAKAFSDCGLETATSEDVESEIWAKAIVNSCINPLTAILRVPNGRLLDDPTVDRLMREICDECVAVAGSVGVRLPEGRMIDRVRTVARDTSANRSSMLRDVELGRRTEVSQLNGMMCMLGAAHGVVTPLNRALAAMVEALEPALLEKA